MKGRHAEPVRVTDTPQPQWTVLLAEDDDAVRNMLSILLIRMGIKVLAAEDGREALILFHKHVSLIDLAILDLEMPNVSGESAFYEMRRVRSCLPVIIISGDNKDCVMYRFRHNPPSDIMQKPILPNSLRQTLRRCITDQRPQEICIPDPLPMEKVESL